MKKIIIFLGLLFCIALLFPVINIIRDKISQETKLVHEGPLFSQAAYILENKCIDCHSSTAKLPFYAQFPLAKKIINSDISEAIERFNLDNKLTNKNNFSELDLARLEGVTTNNSMAPWRYILMHWNKSFNNNDKKIIKDWIYEHRAQSRIALGISKEFAGDPIAPLQVNKQLDPQKVMLGKLLFHDTRLSGDNTLSCASCHSLVKGGTDQAVSSTGIRGQRGPINAPTVFNAVYNHRQFWDGRAADLEEQAGGPVTNPMEMGATWPEVMARLSQDTKLTDTFAKLYSHGLTQQNILNAIAVFEQSLVTPNSRFDKYLYGDKNILSSEEIHGYELFKNNCISCHAGQSLGGLSFEKLGLKVNFQSRRTPNDADQGRFNVTKNIIDKHKFKVPTLRNIDQSYPYFHDGSVKTLEEAVALMGKYQAGKNFTTAEINDISAFLRSLTGEYEGRLLSDAHN